MGSLSCNVIMPFVRGHSVSLGSAGRTVGVNPMPLQGIEITLAEFERIHTYLRGVRKEKGIFVSFLFFANKTNAIFLFSFF